jgi:hypothetical protein
MQLCAAGSRQWDHFFQDMGLESVVGLAASGRDVIHAALGLTRTWSARMDHIHVPCGGGGSDSSGTSSNSTDSRYLVFDVKDKQRRAILEGQVVPVAAMDLTPAAPAQWLKHILGAWVLTEVGGVPGGHVGRVWWLNSLSVSMGITSFDVAYFTLQIDSPWRCYRWPYHTGGRGGLEVEVGGDG